MANSGINGSESAKEIIYLHDYNLINQILPSFDGNTKNLNCYIRSVEKILSIQNIPTNDAMIVCMIRAKLSSKALEALSLEVDIDDWLSIRNALINRFGEHRTETQLLHEMMKCSKSKSESCEAYGNRIRELLDALCGVGLEERKDRRQYQNIAISTFVENISYEIGLGVRIHHPTTLEAAIALARQEEIRMKASSSNNNNNVQEKTNNAPIVKFPPRNLKFKPNYYFNQRMPFQHRQYSSRPMFQGQGPVYHNNTYNPKPQIKEAPIESNALVPVNKTQKNFNNNYNNNNNYRGPRMYQMNSSERPREYRENERQEVVRRVV